MQRNAPAAATTPHVGIQAVSPRSWGERTLPWRAWRRRCDVLHCASSGAPAWRPVSIVMTAHDLIPALQLNGQNQSERRDFFVTCVAEQKSRAGDCGFGVHTTRCSRVPPKSAAKRETMMPHATTMQINSLVDAPYHIGGQKLSARPNSNT